MGKEKKEKFVENRDYYLEEGRVHFTKEYLISRGPCCGGECRHCPYNERIKGNVILRNEN
jgi:hypothetical protein